MTHTPNDEAVARAILGLVAARAPGASICPTEAARVLAPGDGWRPLLAGVRRVAAALARDGRLEILRKGRPIDPGALHGVIRLRAPLDVPAPDVPTLDTPSPDARP